PPPRGRRRTAGSAIVAFAWSSPCRRWVTSLRAVGGTVTDRQPGGRVEEVQGVRVDHELDRTSLAHLGAGVEAGQDGGGATPGCGFGLLDGLGADVGLQLAGLLG